MESSKKLKEINTGRITALRDERVNSIQSMFDIYQLISEKLSIPLNEIRLLIKDKFIGAGNYSSNDGAFEDVMKGSEISYFAKHHENKLVMVEYQKEKFHEKEEIVTKIFPFT